MVKKSAGKPENPAYDKAKLTMVAVLAVFAYLALVNLDYTPFWDDEAISPSVARNLLSFGSPLADDGRNIMSYYGGEDIAPDLTYRYPRLGIYMQAGVFMLFGTGETQARALSALFALAAMIMFAGILRREFPNRPGFVALALVFACFLPMTLPYARSATYNSAVLFFNVLLFWSYLRFCERPRIRFALLIMLAAVAGFHAHYLSSLVFVATLFLFHVLFRRDRFNRRAWLLATAAALPYIASIAWFALEYPGGGYSSRKESLSTLKMVLLYFSALNQNGILSWSVALWFLGRWGLPLFAPRKKIVANAAKTAKRLRPDRKIESRGKPFENRVFQFFAFVLIATFILSLTAPHAGVRYMSSIAPFAAPVSAAAVLWAWQFARPAGVLLGCVLLLSNLAGYPFLKHFIYGNKPQWTLPALVAEYHSDYTEPMRPVIRYLKKHADQDDVVFAPNVRSSRFIYYLSDKILICCDLSADKHPPDTLRTEGREYLFKENIMSGVVKADWVIFFGETPLPDPKNSFGWAGSTYTFAARMPGVWFPPFELWRPEPVYHVSFPPQKVESANRVYIYHRKAGAIN